MIKYKIIHKKSINTHLVETCMTILEIHGIDTLPAVNSGEKKTIFEDKKTRISIVGVGTGCGYFTIRETSGDCIGFFKSGIFEY